MSFGLILTLLRTQFGLGLSTKTFWLGLGTRSTWLGLDKKKKHMVKFSTKTTRLGVGNDDPLGSTFSHLTYVI